MRSDIIDSENTTTNSIVSLSSWAASTTKAWANEVRQDMRRQRRLQNMARHRNQKRLEMQQLKQDRDHLELDLKQRLAALAPTKKPGQQEASTNKSNDDADLGQLALESSSLRDDNVKLHQRLKVFRSVWAMISDAALMSGFIPKKDLATQSVYEAGKVSQWVVRSRQNISGWRVTFPNAEPPFYFSPLSRDECDRRIHHCSENLSKTRSQMQATGNVFGWTVHRSSLARLEDNSFITRARFTTRAPCPFDAVRGSIDRSPLNMWPLIATPEDWSHDRAGVSVQVLQEFDELSRVIVTNIPGPVHLRYMHLAWSQPGRTIDNKREIRFITIAVDSDTNRRNRSAEQLQDVRWATEGGCYCKISEVNDSTVDISFEQWATYENDRHAQQLFLQWAQFVCREGQQMTQSKLLK